MIRKILKILLWIAITFIGLCIILLGLFIFNDELHEPVKHYPIEEGELLFKKGDCLAYKTDSIHYGVAVVIFYVKEEDGIWYGLTFTDYQDTVLPQLSDLKKCRFYGRKVHSSLDSKGYSICLDIDFVKDSCLKAQANLYDLIGNLQLKSSVLIAGSQSANCELNELVTDYQFGKEKRKLPPDHYTEHLTKLNNFRPDEYFAITYFLRKQ